MGAKPYETLPEIARREGLSLDGLRGFVRRSHWVKALGVHIGPTRCYTGSESAAILKAYREHLAKRQ